MQMSLKQSRQTNTCKQSLYQQETKKKIFTPKYSLTHYYSGSNTDDKKISLKDLQHYPY